MALRPQFSLIHSEYNEFLFASVGEEKNGIPLTVLSALTRLGFDPWGEAARLSDLPKEAAARALAAAIAALPEGDWAVSDARAIAARLVSRLPGSTALAAQPPQGESGRRRMTKSAALIWLFFIVLAAAAALAIWSG
jgi:hypothetical protein